MHSKPKSNSEIVLYQTEDGRTRLEVRLENESVWLSLNQLAELFQRDKSVVSRHIKNVFEDGELARERVVADFATTAADGKVYQVEFFNLDVIISVGYRVKSHRGTQFRIWATQRLREFIVKGSALDDERFKRGGGGNYRSLTRGAPGAKFDRFAVESIFDGGRDSGCRRADSGVGGPPTTRGAGGSVVLCRRRCPGPTVSRRLAPPCLPPASHRRRYRGCEGPGAVHRGSGDLEPSRGFGGATVVLSGVGSPAARGEAAQPGRDRRPARNLDHVAPGCPRRTETRPAGRRLGHGTPAANLHPGAIAITAAAAAAGRDDRSARPG